MFGEPRAVFRGALVGLRRYIVTPETSKHRFFVFLDSFVIAEGSLIIEAFEDAFFLGVLSSRVHVTWALAAGGRLGVGNDPRYNKTRCFDPFPFPECTDEQGNGSADQRSVLTTIARRGRLCTPSSKSPTCITSSRNCVRGTLSVKERVVHEQGVVSVLKQLHDEHSTRRFLTLTAGLTISLTRRSCSDSVGLNHERKAEEERAA